MKISTRCTLDRPQPRTPPLKRRNSVPTKPPPPPPKPPSELGCAHFADCGGCTLENGLAAPPALQAAATYFAEVGHPGFGVHPGGELHHWRHRARLAVRRDVFGAVCVGLFEQGTHDAVDIPLCKAHHPAINAAADLVRACLEGTGVQPYDESSGGGQLRYLQLTVVQEEAGQLQVQAVLVWNAADAASAPGLQEFASALWEADQRGPDPPLLQSIVANYQPLVTNVIMGESFELLHGPTTEGWVPMGAAEVCFDPGSFMQANPHAMSAVLEVMQRAVQPGWAVADLHAGVGTIGLSLAASCHLSSLRLVEINPLAEEPFRRSWRRLQGRHPAAALPAAVEFHVAAAGSDPARWAQGADALVVDPPRKGLEPGLLDFLCAEAAAEGPPPQLQRLFYLSCGWKAFERDCSALLNSGQWALDDATAFSFFPGTNHIETLAIFDRRMQ